MKFSIVGNVVFIEDGQFTVKDLLNLVGRVTGTRPLVTQITKVKGAQGERECVVFARFLDCSEEDLNR